MYTVYYENANSKFPQSFHWNNKYDFQTSILFRIHHLIKKKIPNLSGKQIKNQIGAIFWSRIANTSWSHLFQCTYLYKESHINHQGCNYANYKAQNSISNSWWTNININLQNWWILISIDAAHQPSINS